MNEKELVEAAVAFIRHAGASDCDTSHKHHQVVVVVAECITHCYSLQHNLLLNIILAILPCYITFHHYVQYS